MAEVDDDQLAALRRLRAAFGFIEVVEVISHDPEDDLAAARMSQSRGQGWPTRDGCPRRGAGKPTLS
jgi:hypothetical protein